MYDRWHSDEPNNKEGNEHFLQYWGEAYKWNDKRGGTHNGSGFIVEYESDDSSLPPTEKTCQPASLSHDFKLHIPLVHYSPLADDDAIMRLSVDLKMEEYSQMLFKVMGYEVIE